MPDDILDAWVQAHARAAQAHAAVRRGRCLMNAAAVVGTLATVGTIAAEYAVLQVTQPDIIRTWGPWVVPVVGVIVGYASFRTAFNLHKHSDALEKAAIKADLEKRVTHSVLDAHLGAIRGDIGDLKAGLHDIREAVSGVAVAVGRLEGRRRDSNA